MYVYSVKVKEILWTKNPWWYHYFILKYGIWHLALNIRTNQFRCPLRGYSLGYHHTGMCQDPRHSVEFLSCSSECAGPLSAIHMSLTLRYTVSLGGICWCYGSPPLTSDCCLMLKKCYLCKSVLFFFNCLNSLGFLA